MQKKRGMEKKNDSQSTGGGKESAKGNLTKKRERVVAKKGVTGGRWGRTSTKRESTKSEGERRF